MYDYYNDMQSCDSGNVKEIGGLTEGEQMLDVIVMCILSGLIGCTVGVLCKGPQPDPPDIERAEIADHFRMEAARLEISERDKAFSVRDIIKALEGLTDGR